MSTTTPQVSVLIITFNRAAYLSKAIDSALNQTFKDFELLIVDGGSTDATPSIVECYVKKDARITYLRQEKKGGVSRDRNIGLRAAQGEYIAILDSDDIWASPEKLAKQVEFLNTHKDHVLVGSGVIEIDPAGQTRATYMNPLSDKSIRAAMLFRNPFAHSSVLFRRTLALMLGGYSEARTIGEDYDLILRMGTKGLLANLPDLFLQYRIHEGSVCVMDKLTGALETKKIVHLYRGSYPYYYLALIKCYIRLLYTWLTISFDTLVKRIKPAHQ